MGKRTAPYAPPPSNIEDDGDDLDDAPQPGPRTGQQQALPQVEQRDTPDAPPAPRPPKQRAGAEVARISVRWKPTMAPPPVPRTQYWLGVTDECPLQNVVLRCGILFPRYSREIPMDKDGVAKAAGVTKGIRVQLTADQVKAIEEDSAREMVRRTGVNACTTDSKDPRYERQPNDMPVGCFIYAVQVAQRMPVDWDQTDPAPIIVVDVDA